MPLRLALLLGALAAAPPAADAQPLGTPPTREDVVRQQARRLLAQADSLRAADLSRPAPPPRTAAAGTTGEAGAAGAAASAIGRDDLMPRERRLLGLEDPANAMDLARRLMDGGRTLARLRQLLVVPFATGQDTLNRVGRGFVRINDRVIRGRYPNRAVVVAGLAGADEPAPLALAHRRVTAVHDYAQHLASADRLRFLPLGAPLASHVPGSPRAMFVLQPEASAVVSPLEVTGLTHPATIERLLGLAHASRPSWSGEAARDPQLRDRFAYLESPERAGGRRVPSVRAGVTLVTTGGDSYKVVVAYSILPAGAAGADSVVGVLTRWICEAGGLSPEDARCR
jgi:hypothetical protein